MRNTLISLDLAMQCMQHITKPTEAMQYMQHLTKAVYTLQFYPTRVPFANGSRRVARVHTASTASGLSGTLRPHQDVFAVDANGSRRLGSAM